MPRGTFSLLLGAGEADADVLGLGVGDADWLGVVVVLGLVLGAGDVAAESGEKVFTGERLCHVPLSWYATK
ncbi:hypothetical protein [Streptomyces vastus]